jgi:hypothetical protein
MREWERWHLCCMNLSWFQMKNQLLNLVCIVCSSLFDFARYGISRSRFWLRASLPAAAVALDFSLAHKVFLSRSILRSRVKFPSPTANRSGFTYWVLGSPARWVSALKFCLSLEAARTIFIPFRSYLFVVVITEYSKQVGSSDVARYVQPRRSFPMKKVFIFSHFQLRILCALGHVASIGLRSFFWFLLVSLWT